MSTTTAPPPPPAVLKSGWGTKQGSFIHNWKRRFFVLREVASSDLAESNPQKVTHLLLYYKSENQATDKGLAPTGVVQLIKSETTVESVDSPSKAVGQPAEKLEPCLKIESPQYDVGSTTPKQRRVLYIVPDESAAQWREAIVQALATKPNTTDHTHVVTRATGEPKDTTQTKDQISASKKKHPVLDVQSPAVEVEYPPSAKFWINAAFDASDHERWIAEAKKVVPWLTKAIINAHRDPKIKRAAVQLLLVEQFTTNLGALECWDLLRTNLIAHLTTLGAELHERYSKLDLGNALSDKRIGCDKLDYHPRLSTHQQDPTTPLTHADLLPDVATHFDFDNDPLVDRTVLVVILMISKALDARFQRQTQTLVGKLNKQKGGTLRAAPTKQYARALNKALSDHLGKPKPRSAYNIDTVRALLMVSDPATMIEAFRLLVMGFGGVAKVKNCFGLAASARADRYNLLSLMLTVVVESGMTFGEMVNDPTCQALFDAFAADVPHGEPKERWERMCKLALAYIRHPAIANAKVCTFGEIQIILNLDALVRKMMHLVYKVVRAESPMQLYDDFWQSYGTRPVEVEADNLRTAASRGQRSVAVALLDGGANVDEGDSDGTTLGTTPLYVAAQRNHPDVVQLLLHRGAAVNTPRNDGVTPLFVAAERNWLDVAQLLVAKNAAIDQARNDGVTPLFIASQDNRLEIVRFLVFRNAALNQAKNTGTTPLFIASKKNRLEVAKCLVANNAAIDQADNNGVTPLFRASQENHLEVVKFLIASNAALNQVMSTGRAPLNIAASNGHLEVVKVLVAAGADLNVRGRWGMPLKEAILCGKADVVAYLRQHDAKEA